MALVVELEKNATVKAGRLKVIAELQRSNGYLAEVYESVEPNEGLAQSEQVWSNNIRLLVVIGSICFGFPM
jgi:hypothetical protein